MSRTPDIKYGASNDIKLWQFIMRYTQYASEQ